MSSTNPVIPLEGTPGTLDPRNPLLIPNFDSPYFEGSSVSLKSAAGFLQSNPRADATATATIGGTVTTGDIVTIELKNSVLPNGYLSHSYTTVGGDTVTTIAENLADLFNDDTTAAAFGIRADVVGAVITFHHNGPVGNFSTLVAPQPEGFTVTCGGTALTGDSMYLSFKGPAFPGGQYVLAAASTTGNTTTQQATALKNAINADATLSGLGVAATSSSAVVSVTVPVALEPVVVAAWVNTTAPATALSTDPAAGDVLSAVVTSTGVTGSPVTVTYTALLGDTTTSAAAGLAAAINANAALSTAGFSASNSTNTLNITQPTTAGQIRYSFSSTGSTTFSGPASVTDTVTLGETATETVTFAPTTGVMSGGTGPIIATNNFNFAPASGGQVSSYNYGRPYLLGYDVISQMVTQGMSIV